VGQYSPNFHVEGDVQGRRHGVDMSTTLLPETIPEIDADPAFFWEGGIGE